MKTSWALALAGSAALAAGAALLSPAADPLFVRLATARARRAAPDRWGGPLVPAPLVSRGRKVAASAPGAERLVDGIYRAGPSWGGGFPSPEKPAWAAIRIGRGPTRLLVSWTSSHNHDYFEQFYGAPVDYRIETSADSTDGADGAWRTAVEVRGNPVRSRAHAVEFAGQRWVRMVVTRLADPVNPWGLYLDEIDVHDLSAGGDDVWVFLGDSIAAGVFDRAPGHRPSFSDWVARLHRGYRPAMIDAGLVRLRTPEVAARVDQVLALNPDARVVAIGIGSNDADAAMTRPALEALVERVRAAGKIPVVARIPFQTKYGPDYVAPKNVAVDAVVAEDRLLPGPDLYALFRRHPERLADGLHPDDRGSVEMSRLWAEAVAPLYP